MLKKYQKIVEIDYKKEFDEIKDDTESIWEREKERLRK